MKADDPAAALATESAASGVPLTPTQIATFLHYQRLIARWNSRARLTALIDPLQVVRLHFIDSLLCLRAPFPGAAAVIDVGSGAGLPGIPLAIARPDLHVTLLESNARKAGFLELAVGELGVRCQVVHERAESAGRMPALREQFDVAVARAVATLPRLAEWTLPFVQVRGLAVLLKGPSVAGELSAAAEIIGALGGEPAQAIFTALPAGEQRAIVTIRKVSTTPTLYPR
ncbi:MAG TPA: 16S rRNA (guanine(527)-N(7))-methyltransferase RsmG [bacterium]